MSTIQKKKKCKDKTQKRRKIETTIETIEKKKKEANFKK